jgi:hypothetical protein
MTIDLRASTEKYYTLNMINVDFQSSQYFAHIKKPPPHFNNNKK